MENNFKQVPTSLFLNGPQLGISSNPQDVIESTGSATFTGIATATFPDQTILDGGETKINWYFDNQLIQDTEIDTNSNATIIDFSAPDGVGSQINIDGIVSSDNNKEIYYTVEYIPSAYQTTPPVTVGTARSTGKGSNEPLKSESAIVTVNPVIEITEQPSDVIIAKTFPAEFTIDAEITPDGGDIEYQWQNVTDDTEVDIVDGVYTQSFQVGATGTLTITGDGSTKVVNLNNTSVYSSFVKGYTYNLKFSNTTFCKMRSRGAEGGKSFERNVLGGQGGAADGKYIFTAGQNYKLRVGGKGGNGTSGPGGINPSPRGGAGGFSGGGTGGKGGGAGGGGGGFTGIFNGPVSHANAIMIAGGGGGGSNDPAVGGKGGGTAGQIGQNTTPARAGKGGGQNSGGAGGFQALDSQTFAGIAGTFLQGGPGAAGGGGGYYGGGGGHENYPGIADGAGGGGSGYVGGVVPSGSGAMTQGGRTGNGFFELKFLSSTKTVTTTVAGSKTKKMTITTDDDSVAVVRCKLSANNVQESPIFSNSVSYKITELTNTVKFETINGTNSATLTQNDLSEGEVTIDYSNFTGSEVLMYAPDKNVLVELDLHGGKGSDDGTKPGGVGGFSRIRFTMLKNVEYVITGLYSTVNTPFIYRKATLIACVGGGGSAGFRSAGGDGGGVNVAGEDAIGSSPGTGGEKIDVGTLSSPAEFGSLVEGVLTAVAPDTNATDREGGKVLPCTRGVYWRDQNVAPCSDVTTGSSFRLADGTTVTNTANINRGYKAGYNVIQTAGKGEASGGNGAAGATGGKGGIDGYGGGGGSGYSDGSIVVIDTQLGGSDYDNATVIMRVVE